MSRVVNGRNWEDVLKLLQNAKPKKGKKMKFEFIPVEEYLKVLDKYVGVTNYTTEYSELQYFKVQSGQDMFTIRCRITILDDDGNVVTFKEGMGGSEFAYSQDNGGRDVNLKNSPVYAQQSAFKTAAKSIGCFDFYGSSDSSDEKPSQNERQTQNAKPAQASSSGGKKVLSVHSVGKMFTVEGREDANGQPTYKLPVKVEGEDVLSEIIFYPNHYDKLADTFNKFIARTSRKGVDFSTSVTQCKEQNGKKQFVFLGFIQNSTKGA